MSATSKKRRPSAIDRLLDGQCRLQKEEKPASCLRRKKSIARAAISKKKREEEKGKRYCAGEEGGGGAAASMPSPGLRFPQGRGRHPGQLPITQGREDSREKARLELGGLTKCPVARKRACLPVSTEVIERSEGDWKIHRRDIARSALSLEDG